MTELGTDERRARPRTSVAVELRIEADGLVMLSRTVNLSSQGAFIRSSRPLPVGTRVTVGFERGQDRNPLQLAAEVVRTGEADDGRSRGIAIRFIDLTPLDESLLGEIIARARA